jgi:hypothetical protein
VNPRFGRFDRDFHNLGDLLVGTAFDIAQIDSEAKHWIQLVEGSGEGAP